MAERIAYVVNRYGPGGLERCVAHLVNGVDRDRYIPAVVSFRNLEEAPNWIADEKVQIVSLNKSRGNDLGLVRRLCRFLSENKISILQSHNWATLAESAIACRLTGVSHIHTEHGQQERAGLTMTGLKRWSHQKVRRAAFNRCRALVACAESVRTGISRQWGFPESRVSYIPNGVEAPLVDESQDRRRDLGIPDSAFVIGSIGRLFGLKAFDDLIRAGHDLLRRGVPVHVVIVGDGSDRDRLVDLTDQLGMNANVHFVGYQADTGNWLRSLDVYVNSSTTEAMSMSILEAMSASCPVVATDVGDSRILVERDGRCGIAVPPSTPIALADAIATYVDDPTIRRQHGEIASAKFAKNYTLSTMLQSYQSLYEATCASGTFEGDPS